MKIALIPARGGSKRISRKNIKAFMGKPMIAWSIEIAKRSGLFDKIYVSTDDAQIAEIARNYGAETPFMRPANLADDYSTTTEVVAHAVRWIEAEGLTIRAICCIYPTAPFLCIEDLEKAWAVFASNQWDYVFSATGYSAPIQRAFRIHSRGDIEMYFPEHFPTRSQDLPMSFHDAAQFYWGKPSAWKSSAPIFGKNSTAVPIPRSRVQDIDTQEDWEHAELLGKVLLKQ